MVFLVRTLEFHWVIFRLDYSAANSRAGASNIRCFLQTRLFYRLVGIVKDWRFGWMLANSRDNWVRRGLCGVNHRGSLQEHHYLIICGHLKVVSPKFSFWVPALEPPETQNAYLLQSLVCFCLASSRGLTAPPDTLGINGLKMDVPRAINVFNYN